MRSELLDLPFWSLYCQRIFGDALPKNSYDQTNKFFGGLDIKGSNILFVNDVEDPWQWAGMREIHNPKTQSNMESLFIDCDNCAHCMDFHTPQKHQPSSLTAVQLHISETIAEWLYQAQEPHLFLH